MSYYQPDAPESVKHWSGRDPSGEPEPYDDPFTCNQCGNKIYRDCVDEIGLCLLCELEEKAQLQLPS